MSKKQEPDEQKNDQGGGPAFHRIGRAIRCRRADIDEFMVRTCVQSVTDVVQQGGPVMTPHTERKDGTKDVFLTANTFAANVASLRSVLDALSIVIRKARKLARRDHRLSGKRTRVSS